MEIYINTYGTYLHVKDQMFAIRTKTEEGKFQEKFIAAHKIKSILFTTQASLSTEAIRLALMNNIDLLFLETNGKPLGRVWHCKLGSTTRIRKQQLVTSMGEQGLVFTKTWLCQKLDNQASFLKDLKKNRVDKQHPFIEEKIRGIEKQCDSIKEASGEKVADIADRLRGWEGTAGRMYFQTLSYLLTKDHQFKGRSSRPAEDPFNAFLNYAYGILYGKVEKALMVAGLDPYVGFMHRDDYNQKSLVFDFIEPYRIYGERVVFHLFAAKKVNQTHTDKITNGFSLNKEGKRLLVEAFQKYTVEEKVLYKRRKESRINILQLQAHEVAQTILAGLEATEEV